MRFDGRRSVGRSALAQGGFVLAVTLWLLAGIAVVVGLVTVWSLEEVRDAARDRESVDDQLATQGTRDALIYLALTRPVTRAGLPTRELDKADRATRLLQEFGGMDYNPRGSELKLDGTQYRGLADTRFAVQDEGGLYPLTLPSPYSLDRFLAGQGVEREGVGNLRDQLLDYMDADELRLLLGAETREYREARMAPPPNRRLRLPEEVHAVLGWERLPLEVRRHIAEVSTVYYVGGLNLNTAPAALLPAFLSGCPQTCEALQARRAQTPFQSGREVETLLGVSLPGDSLTEYRFAPSQNLRITVWGRTGTATRIHVELAPLTDQHAPWYVLAAYPVPRPSSNAPAQSTDSALLADPPAG
jgi:hypothetical protein